MKKKSAENHIHLDINKGGNMSELFESLKDIHKVYVAGATGNQDPKCLLEKSVPELLKVCRALEPTLTDREILEKLKQAMESEAV